MESATASLLTQLKWSTARSHRGPFQNQKSEKSQKPEGKIHSEQKIKFQDSLVEWFLLGAQSKIVWNLVKASMMCMLGLSIASCKQGCEIATDDAQAAVEGDEVGLVDVGRCDSGCFKSSNGGCFHSSWTGGEDRRKPKEELPKLE